MGPHLDVAGNPFDPASRAMTADVLATASHWTAAAASVRMARPITPSTSPAAPMLSCADAHRDTG